MKNNMAWGKDGEARVGGGPGAAGGSGCGFWGRSEASRGPDGDVVTLSGAV